jgi:GGDEF domain-containing protein
MDDFQGSDDFLQDPPTGPTDLRSQVIEALQRENAALRLELEKVQEAQRGAFRDAVTGLGNRQWMVARLDEELSRAERLGGEVSVVAIRLLGEPNPASLKEATRLIQLVSRDYDVCARTGDQELAVLLLHAGAAECDQFVRRLQDRLNHMASNGSRHLELSLGWSTSTDLKGGDARDDMLRSAEAVLEFNSHMRDLGENLLLEVQPVRQAVNES